MYFLFTFFSNLINVLVILKNNLKDDELIGDLIMSRTILAPLNRIVENTGVGGAVVVWGSLKIRF